MHICQLESSMRIKYDDWIYNAIAKISRKYLPAIRSNKSR